MQQVGVWQVAIHVDIRVLAAVAAATESKYLLFVGKVDATSLVSGRNSLQMMFKSYSTAAAHGRSTDCAKCCRNT